MQSSPDYLRFRESHHAVARWFALGLTISEVARKTGYSRRRLHILLGDPSFQELIVSYHKDIDNNAQKDIDSFDELQTQARNLAESLLVERLLTSLEDGADPLPLSMLNKISQDRADRTGYSKHTRQTIEIGFADALDRAIERSNSVRLINVEARPVAPSVIHAPVRSEDVTAEPQPSPKAIAPSFAKVLSKRTI